MIGGVCWESLGVSMLIIRMGVDFFVCSMPEAKGRGKKDANMP